MEMGHTSEMAHQAMIEELEKPIEEMQELYNNREIEK